MANHPFTSGELTLHHRYEQGQPITCGAPQGCVTSRVEDVACPDCIAKLVDKGTPRWMPESGCPNCPPGYDCESGNYFTGAAKEANR